MAKRKTKKKAKKKTKKKAKKRRRQFYFYLNALLTYELKGRFFYASSEII